MLLSQLETFVEVARSGNISRAAEALFLTQPALTGRLKALESELGTPLFTRNRRGVQLTEAGRTFLPYARRALEATVDGAQAIADLRVGGGSLTVAVSAIVAADVLPAALDRFRHRHPKAVVSVRAANQDDVVEMVLDGQADIGITRDVRHPDLERVELYEDELLLVVHPTHRLAAARTVRIDDLADEHFILFDRSSSYAELTTALFRGTRVIPKSVLNVNNVGAIAKMVQAGQGIAILPRSGIRDELAAGTLHALRVTGGAPVRHSMVAIRRRATEPPSAHMRGLVAELRVVSEVVGLRAHAIRKVAAVPARRRAVRRA